MDILGDEMKTEIKFKNFDGYEMNGEKRATRADLTMIRLYLKYAKEAERLEAELQEAKRENHELKFRIIELKYGKAKL